MTRIAILGGGPAGCGAAYKLRLSGKADVVLYERNSWFGGNAGSFDKNGFRLDFGSHRLHPVTDADVLKDVKDLLGPDLLDRPRHGRMCIQEQWVHFPPKPVDLLLNLDKSFAFGAFGDMITKPFRNNGRGGENFGSVMRANLGGTICDQFYFPLAEKIWGLKVSEMSAEQARRRVANSSFWKLICKVLNQIPGLRRGMTGRFYYPRRGFGQITEAYATAAQEKGAIMSLATSVTALEKLDAGWRVVTKKDGQRSEEVFDQVWSTIPLTILARLMAAAPPTEILTAIEEISYRAMILVYLEIERDQFTEYDAHYLPQADVVATRLSEPKNYAALTEPQGRTVICAEVPCEKGDEIWSSDDQALGARVAKDLRRIGLPVPEKLLSVWTARLPQAYPVYRQGFEFPWGKIDAWAEGLSDFLTYGRQGLFAHDNTHHALRMAYSAVDCLNEGEFDHLAWARYREEFSKHVVED